MTLASEGDVVHASVNLNASGDLIAASTGFRHRVISYALVCGGANTVRFQTSSTSAAVNISGLLSFAANGGVVCPDSGNGWMQTALHDKLNLTLSTVMEAY